MLELQILSGVLLTSILSGIIGMGGGLILMGLYTFLLPVKSAMILHGVTQFSSNGFRGFLHKEHIQWKILKPYFFGALIVFGFLRFFEFIPSKAFVLILSGSFTFISFIPFIADRLDILKKGRAFICGGVVTLAQILAGASGGTLDIFYVNSSLDKHKVIASKAMTQTFGHFIKLVYYLSLASLGTSVQNLDWWIYPGVALTAFLGTRIGKIALDRLSENNFRKYSKVLILLIGLSLIWRGILLSNAEKSNQNIFPESKKELNIDKKKNTFTSQSPLKIIADIKASKTNLNPKKIDCLDKLRITSKNNRFLERNKEDLDKIVGSWFYEKDTNINLNSIEPKSQTELFLLGLAHAGLIEEFKTKKQNLTKAEELLKEAAQNDPQNASPWLYLAHIENKFGDKKLEEKYLKNANKANFFDSYEMNLSNKAVDLAKIDLDYIEIGNLINYLPIVDIVALAPLIIKNQNPKLALVLMEGGLDPENKNEFLDWSALEYAVGYKTLTQIVGGHDYPNFKELIEIKKQSPDNESRLNKLSEVIRNACEI